MKATITVLAISAFFGLSAASSEPRVEGPLFQAGPKECEEATLDSDGSEAALEKQVCLWWFRYAPVAETNLARDYGILWLQASLDPRSGFCLDRAKIGLRAKEQFEPLAGPLPRKISVGKAKNVLIRVRSDANGHGIQKGSVTQEVTARRGIFRVSSLKSNGWVTAFWMSEKQLPIRNALSFAIGIEIAWNGNLPEQLLSTYQIERYVDAQYGRC